MNDQGSSGYQTDVGQMRQAAAHLVNAASHADLSAAGLRERADLSDAVPFDSATADSGGGGRGGGDGGFWDTAKEYGSKLYDLATTPAAVANIDALGKGLVGAIKGPYRQATDAVSGFGDDVTGSLREIGERIEDAAGGYQEREDEGSDAFGRKSKDLGDPALMTQRRADA